MTRLSPAEVTALAEPVANKMSGTFGGVCQTCTGPRQVQYWYDDPLKTPVTDLTTRFLTPGNELLAETKTYKPMNFGAEDGTESVLPNRPAYGLAEQADLPRTPLTIDTGALPDIESAADAAWALEQDIAGQLWDFETRMKSVFGPYAEEWKRTGWGGAAQSFVNGVGRGIEAWWESESDFWGSTWGWLKSTAADVGDYVDDGLNNGPLPPNIGMFWIANLGLKAGHDIADGLKSLFADVNIMEYIEPLHDMMRAFLLCDIDGFIGAFQRLTGLKDLKGAIGEFGRMIEDVTKKGVDTMRDIVELMRRTPLLGLISSMFMRIVLMMTPNFWAKLSGEGVGFIIPELIVWAVTALIAALSAGAGAVVLAQRATKIAQQIRNAIKGGAAVAKLLSFLDGLWVLIDKIKDMGLLLRRSINEMAEGVVDVTQRKFIPARIWRQKLARLKHHGPGAHGVQRHEGDVTVSQLDRRCMHGIDPMTGSTKDGVHGGIHRYGRDATKIKTPADFVRAYEKALKHPSVKAKMAAGLPEVIEVIPIEILLGKNWNSRILGRTRIGSAKNPLNSIDTKFKDETKVFIYLKQNNGGGYYLYTMYPRIK